MSRHEGFGLDVLSIKLMWKTFDFMKLFNKWPPFMKEWMPSYIDITYFTLSNFLFFIYLNLICSLYFLVDISNNIHTKQQTLCLLYYRLCGDIDSECGFDVFHPNLFYTNVLQRRISCSWSLQLELGSRTPILHLITHRSEILKQVQYKFVA